MADMTINKSSTWRSTFTWSDASGSAIDLTGCSAKMQVRTDDARRDLLLELSTDNGMLTIPTGTDGIISLEVTPAQMTDVPVGVHIVDQEITFTDASETPTDPWYIEFKDGITQ